MHNLRDLRQRANSPRPDARHEQKFSEISRAVISGGSQSGVETPGDDVLRPNVVAAGHDEMRKIWLCWQNWILDAIQLNVLTLNTVRPELVENLQLSPTGGVRTPIGQVDDDALVDALNGRVRRFDKTLQAFGKPVITSSLAEFAVHPLLNYYPVSIVRYDESMEIEVNPSWTAALSTLATRRLAFASAAPSKPT